MRIHHAVILAAALLAAACGTAGAVSDAAADEERREIWTGSLYSSTYRAGICINAHGDLRGAVYLRQITGAVDRYTVSGKVEDDRITAAHHSGHEFRGRFASPDSVRGELKLKNGRTLEVRAARSQNAEVDESCRLYGAESEVRDTPLP